MKYFAISDKGLVRDNNEDSIACEKFGDTLCMVVADGLGGQEKGEIASMIAVTGMMDILRENEDKLISFDESAIVEILEGSYQKINSKILLRACYNKECIGMSTTLTCAILNDKRLIISHLGDCRAYLLHGSKLEVLTLDHTYAAELIKSNAPGISEDEYKAARNMLTKYLGENIFITPDIYRYNVMYGDLILLCSDGLYAYIDEDKMRSLLRIHSDLQKCAKSLIDEVFENGANDNVSLILAHNRPDDKKEFKSL
ncbi:MAG: serine/threonine-protein phosphatase [Clostridiales bacterium]|nr:serine/threonine-protein phosphatase [Clostridiales bacterium]